MKTDKCRSCGAPIIWTVTSKGKRMPVDAKPVEGGNVRLDQDLLGNTVASIVPDGTGDRVSHFATCPEAARWRRG